MPRTRFRTCYISAPFGANTSVLRKALRDKAIQWSDLTNLEAGGSWAGAVDRAISKADFVCTVLPEGHHANVLFELGVAYAKHKPILALLASSARLPTDIISLTYVRADPKDAATVRAALGAFLDHARGEPFRSTSRRRTKRRSIAKESTALPPSASAHEFELKTVSLLEKAGVIVSWPTQRSEQGADLAVWIDDLPQSLGNPLLVEIKAGNLSKARITQAASQLRQYVVMTHGSCGLLVYWDRQNRQFPSVSTEWPLIFRLSGETLERLAHRGQLSRELVRLRNAAVHGEV